MTGETTYLQPIVIEGMQKGGQLMITTDVENYPGFPDGILGPEVMELFRKQAERFGTRFVWGDVTKVEVSGWPFRLYTEDQEIVTKTLIVATGGKIYVQNKQLNTVGNYDLSDTPFGILLDQDVDLKTKKAILGVEEQKDALIIHARTSANRNQSNITLVFSFPEIELRQWMVTDNQGGTTTVALTGTETGITLDPTLFAVPKRAPFRPGGPNWRSARPRCSGPRSRRRRR